MLSLSTQMRLLLSKNQSFSRTLLSQHQKKFSALYSFEESRPSLTSNKFLLIQNPIDTLPYIQFNQRGNKIQLNKDLSLAELEKQLKQTGEIKNDAEFYAPDGASIAKVSKLHHLLHIPYFVMRLDNIREYNVMSEKSFSLRNKKFTLNVEEKSVYDACKDLNMRDQKAVEISRFLSKFQNQIQVKPEWSQNEILIVIREVLASKARNTKEEKEVLGLQLALLKKQREPTYKMIAEIETQAEKQTHRVLLSFCSIFVTQFMLVQYGTYIAFSWDIMEPITCGMTLGDAICSYFFWLWSKKPYSIAGLKEFFFERKKSKLIRRNNLDYDNFLKTEEAIQIIKNRLKELE